MLLARGMPSPSMGRNDEARVAGSGEVPTGWRRDRVSSLVRVDGGCDDWLLRVICTDVRSLVLHTGPRRTAPHRCKGGRLACKGDVADETVS